MISGWDRIFLWSFGTFGGSILYSGSELIDGRAVFRAWDGFSLGFGGTDPGLFGDLDLFEGILGSIPESGAVCQVGDVGNVSAVQFTIKYVYMIIFHVTCRCFYFFFCGGGEIFSGLG